MEGLPLKPAVVGVWLAAAGANGRRRLVVAVASDGACISAHSWGQAAVRYGIAGLTLSPLFFLALSPPPPPFTTNGYPNSFCCPSFISKVLDVVLSLAILCPVLLLFAIVSPLTLSASVKS